MKEDLGAVFYNGWMTNIYRKPIFNGKSLPDIWFDEFCTDDVEINEEAVKAYFKHVKELFISLDGVANIKYWEKFDFDKIEDIIKICNRDEILSINNFIGIIDL